jgi:hypothetical protein
MAGHEFSADRDTMATPHENLAQGNAHMARFLANFHTVPLAAIGHMDQTDAGHYLEQFA